MGISFSVMVCFGTVQKQKTSERGQKFERIEIGPKKVLGVGDNIGENIREIMYLRRAFNLLLAYFDALGIPDPLGRHVFLNIKRF